MQPVYLFLLASLIASGRGYPHREHSHKHADLREADKSSEQEKQDRVHEVEDKKVVVHSVDDDKEVVKISRRNDGSNRKPEVVAEQTHVHVSDTVTYPQLLRYLVDLTRKGDSKHMNKQLLISASALKSLLLNKKLHGQRKKAAPVKEKKVTKDSSSSSSSSSSSEEQVNRKNCSRCG